jgi:hypothetical protein
MADLQQLADQYLVTIDGRSPQDPCGAWCGDGDVDQWTQVVRTIANQFTYLLKSNRAIDFDVQLMAEVVRWMLRARRFKGGGITDVFGLGLDDVQQLVRFAQQGVQLMFEVETVIEAKGGTVPEPLPEPSPDVLPGQYDNAWWLAGGMLLTLVLIQAWSSR